MCVCVCVFKNIYFKQTHIKIVFLVKGQSQYVNDVMRHKFKVSFYTCWATHVPVSNLHPSRNKTIYLFLHITGYIPWRRKWQPTPVSSPGKAHGQKSLVGCSPWGRKESGTTGRLTLTYLQSIWIKFTQRCIRHSTNTNWLLLSIRYNKWSESTNQVQSMTLKLRRSRISRSIHRVPKERWGDCPADLVISISPCKGREGLLRSYMPQRN